ncbi:hypothetical protein [Geodermatophilus sp. SYSU D01105]
MASTGAQHLDRRYRLVRIPLRTRWRLQWYARSDRRAGLPVGLSADSTPLLSELVAEYREVCEREWTGCLRDNQSREVSIDRIDAELDHLRAALQREANDVSRLSEPLSEDWLSLRYPGEEQLTESAVRRRRIVAHQRAVERARSVVQETQESIDARLSERAELKAQCDTRTDVARSHVVHHQAVASRKAAIYRRALVRRHPERDELIRGWTTELCPLPAWADPTMAAAPSGVAA